MPFRKSYIKCISLKVTITRNRRRWKWIIWWTFQKWEREEQWKQIQKRGDMLWQPLRSFRRLWRAWKAHWQQYMQFALTPSATLVSTHATHYICPSFLPLCLLAASANGGVEDNKKCIESEMKQVWRYVASTSSKGLFILIGGMKMQIPN